MSNGITSTKAPRRVGSAKGPGGARTRITGESSLVQDLSAQELDNANMGPLSAIQHQQPAGLSTIDRNTLLRAAGVRLRSILGPH